MTCLLCQSGLGMLKRKAVPDTQCWTCYRCRNGIYDKEIFGSDECPRCSHKMKEPVAGYSLVCTQCEKVIYQ